MGAGAANRRKANAGPTTLPTGRLALLFAALFALAAALPERACAELTAREVGLDPARTAVVSLHVDAEPELVWQVLRDLESWPRFVPDLEHFAVSKDAAGRPIVEQHQRVLGLPIRTTALVEADAPSGTLRLTLAPGAEQDVESMTILWRVRPDPRGGTRLELASYVDSGRPIPAFVERQAVALSIRGAVDGLAREVDRRQATLPAYRS